MKIINWNISWSNAVDNKISYLKELVAEASFVIILQEVKMNSYEALKKAFADVAKIEYSLEYRAPGKYDTDSRKLGVAILVSKDIEIIDAKVLDRALMPDRTLLVDIKYRNSSLRVLGLHSITGCQHLKAKEIQFFSFAEAIDEYRPDIVGIDANEPQYDHYEISKMKFFDNYNKGNGCKTFFESLQACGLMDAYVKDYDTKQHVEGEYLTTSHVIKRGNKKVRYDFVFVNEEKIVDYHCRYDYCNAVEAGSDHAAVIIDVCHG